MKKGKIYTYSIVYSASESFSDKTPYIVAIIEDGNNKFLSRIDGYNEQMDVAVGKEVEILATENDADMPLCKLL